MFSISSGTKPPSDLVIRHPLIDIHPAKRSVNFQRRTSFPTKRNPEPFFMTRGWKQDPPSENDGVRIPAMDLSSLRSISPAGMGPASSHLSRSWDLPRRSLVSSIPKKRNPVPNCSGTGFYRKSWHRPTLPYSYPYSTIGSEGLNFSVRNGKRCYTLDIDTRN